MRLDEITIQANHHSIPFVTHARIRRNALSVHILWGYFYAERFCRYHEEVLSYQEHPELDRLHDGFGWNIQEVNDFAGSVAQFDDQPPTTALSTH